jgi:hypothetical protein
MVVEIRESSRYETIIDSNPEAWFLWQLRPGKPDKMIAYCSPDEEWVHPFDCDVGWIHDL